MRYLKQNFWVIIAILLLIVNLYKTADLSREYYQLREEVAANNIDNQPVYSDPVEPRVAKEVMSPSELAKYLNVPMYLIYDMTGQDHPIPHTVINGEYRFNKAAVDKWMESVHKIETRP
jgi:excisionase family DNA binding protein